jgi:hypothetical protein
VSERSGFVKTSTLPAEVLEVRNRTRRSHFEAFGRPEQVLWHQKTVRLRSDRVAQVDSRFNALTEIFRLDLRRWLAHTDDPKRQILFADPADERVYSANAPRVYNLGIVYRLTSDSDPDPPWQRIRVVVSRKGILRIDSIL